MIDSDLDATLLLSSPEARSAWARISQQPRAFFDALSAEWNSMHLDDKLHVLRQLEGAGILDLLLADYITTYLQHNCHVLDGMAKPCSPTRRLGSS